MTALELRLADPVDNAGYTICIRSIGALGILRVLPAHISLMVIV